MLRNNKNMASQNFVLRGQVTSSTPHTSPHPPPGVQLERTARQEERSKERAGERERRSSPTLVLLLLSLFVSLFSTLLSIMRAAPHYLNTCKRRIKSSSFDYFTLSLVKVEISTISYLWCTTHHTPRSPRQK